MSEYTGPSDDEINLAKRLWSVEQADLTFIRGNENWVYSFNEYIFRFTADYHRSAEEITAELDWIIYLGHQNLSVSTPIASINQSFIEKISDKWTCVVFKKAPGVQLTKPNQFTKEVFVSWGTLTGAIHKKTQFFAPTMHHRNQWNNDDCYLLCQHALQNTDASHPMAVEYTNSLKKLNDFKKTPDSFGLIHGDFHHGNFHFDFNKDQLTLFDFDDSNYFWYAFDLVVPFASLKLSKAFRGLDLDYQDLQLYFMEAYHREYTLDSYWLGQLSVFEKYRYASLYFWSKARLMRERTNNESSDRHFMDLCEKLTLTV